MLIILLVIPEIIIVFLRLNIVALFPLCHTHLTKKRIPTLVVVNFLHFRCIFTPLSKLDIGSFQKRNIFSQATEEKVRQCQERNSKY